MLSPLPTPTPYDTSSPEPYYRDDWTTLYFGDCQDILPHLPAVDVVITDPPYDEHTHAAVRSREMSPRDRGASGAASARTIDLGFDPLTPELRHCAATHFSRLARRWVLAFSDIESAPLWRQDLTDAGLEYIRTGAWIRENGAPQFSGDRPACGFDAITIAHPHGRKHWNGGGKRAIWTVPVVIDRGHTGARLHPAQKPAGLLHTLVTQFSDPGEVILDAFAGSGTTLAAATILGRRSIGIENNERHCETIARRLSQTPVLPFDPPTHHSDDRSVSPLF